MMRSAVFLDRDGTLVYPRHYPSRPEELVLYEDIGGGLRRLREAGYALVVITNQSGIARGLFDEDDLARMHTHLRGELRKRGIEVDGIYHCPHHVDGVVPELAVACTCRKPQPGMLLRAAAELDLDLASSWLLGDILDDVEAGNRAGCSTVLVDIGTEGYAPSARRTPRFVARSTAHALDIVLAVTGYGPDTDLEYRSARWVAAHASRHAYMGGVHGQRG